MQPIDADIAEALGLDRPQGVLVLGLAAASPFAEAGVRPGDVILSIAGHPVNAPGELLFRLSLQELGTRCRSTCCATAGRVTVAVEMRAAASAGEGLDVGPVTVTSDGPFEGLVVQEITPALRARLGLPARRRRRDRARHR